MKNVFIIMMALLIAITPVFATVAPEPVCEEGQQVIVSDETTMIGDAYAVATWAHPAWGSLPGATWVWATSYVNSPTVDETVTFTKTFTVDGTATNAELQILTDNSYKVWLDDEMIGEDMSEANYATADVYALDLAPGTYTLTFEVKNWALEGADAYSNPAGLAYTLTYDQTCEPPVDVPEFGAIAAIAVIAAGLGIVAFRRK